MFSAMHRKYRIIFSALVTGFIGPAPANAQGSALPADLVLTNGIVFTVDDERPWAEAVAVNDGVISFVGDAEGVLDMVGPGTEIVNLDGRLLLPGFQDAHVHPLEGNVPFVNCDLLQISSEDPDPENWIEHIRSCGESESIHGWVLGWGHSSRQLRSLDRMPRQVLDEALPETPAAFMERSSHSIWVNTRGLEVAGITRHTKHPTGGKIFKDPVSGEPTGIVADSAGDELMHRILAGTPELQEARYEALLIAQDMLARNGITSAVNARVYWDRGNLEPWLRAEEAGTLKSRSIQSLWAYPHMDDDQQIETLKSMYRNDRHALLRLSQVKFYSDGVTSLNSAATLEPYGLLVHRYADPTGGNYFTEDRLVRYITELEQVGFGVIIHAIGDRAVRESLNAFERAWRVNIDLRGNQLRHYITHVGWVHPDDIPRFAELNVPADTQINFESDNRPPDETKRSREYEQLLANNVSDLNALPEIVQAGASVVFSSDWDVSTVNPLVSIRNAHSQLGGVLDIQEIVPFAVRAYTLNAAWALDHEELTGSIEVGKYADLVVLDRNIFSVPPEDIATARVLMTYLAGKAVYSSEQAP